MAKQIKFGHVEDSLKYARDVVSGRIDAGKWVKLACKRQLDDLIRWPGKKGKFIWDPEKAERICRFIENLPHIEGDQANNNESIQLEPWQKFILCCVFGWVRPNGKRRFRTAYTEVPRKNGKSTMTAGVGLFMTTADGEAGAKVFSAAVKREQAKIVFNTAKNMALKEKEFRDFYGVEVLTNNINVVNTASKFEPISREAGAEEGSNVHCGLVDELHRHKTREVFDMLKTGTAGRSQPLIFIITTAGFDRAGICYEQRTYVTKILTGVREDDTYFGIIYQIDDEDDWRKEKSWKKANPNYGISVNPDIIKAEFLNALAMSSAQTTFLTKHLGRWVNSSSSWMNMQKWIDQGDTSLDLRDFEGEPCWMGVDLASKIDIASVALLFWRYDEYYFFSKNYLPEENVAAEAHAETANYAGWARDGHLILTPGNVIDIDRIEKDIKEFASRFEISAIAFDPWNGAQIMGHLVDDGAPVVELRPNVQNYSEPMKQVEAETLAGRIHHEGSPVVNWAMSNVVVRTDANDNIFPRKERPKNKIDPIVALISAMNRAIVRDEDDDGPSVYEQRGILTV